MNIVQLGLLATSIVSYFFAYKYYVSERYKFSITLILLGALLLRLIAIQDPYIYEWDERYHFLVAKNMMNNFFVPKLYAQELLEYNYKNWTSNFIWLHKPPFSLWCIALSFKIFGVSEITGRIPSLLFSISCVYLTYKIAFKLTENVKIGLIAAFFHSINGLIIEMSVGRAATDHIDTTFFFLIELIVYLSIIFSKKRQILWIPLIGLLIGVAILTKWFIALFAIAMFFIINISKENKWITVLNTLILGAIAFAIFYCWNNYIMLTFPNEAKWEKDFNSRHLFEVIEGHGHSWFFHIDKARVIWNECIYIVFLWFLFLWYKDFWNRSYFTLGFWIIVPYSIFSIAATKMQGYLLFTAPAFFTLIAMFLEYNKQYFQNNKYLKYIPLIIVALSVRYGVERLKPFKNIDLLAQKKEQILNYGAQFDNKTVLFNTKDYVEVMFYTNLVAYQRIPTEAEVEKMKEKGYTIAIINNVVMPNYIQMDKSIKLINP